MEFVGRRVRKKKKELGGGGGGGEGAEFGGIVESYDAVSGLFKIVYEDGVSEVGGLSAVAALLSRGEEEEEEEEEKGIDRRPRVGRKPKKRRRVEQPQPKLSGEGDQSSRNLDLNRGLDVDLNESAERGIGGFDLNAGFNLNLNEGFDLNVESSVTVGFEERAVLMVAVEEEEKKKRGCIDLNVDVNGDYEDGENSKGVDLEGNVAGTQKRECGFDLNLVVEEETRDDLEGDCVAEVNGSTSFRIDIEETRKMEGSSRVINYGGVDNGVLVEVHVANGFCVGSAAVEDFSRCEPVEVLDAKDEGIRGDTIVRKEVRGRKGRRKKIVENLNSMPGTMPLDASSSKVACNMAIDENQGHLGSAHKETSTRRGRRSKVAGNLNSVPETTVSPEANGVKEANTIANDGNVGGDGSSYIQVSRRRGRRRKLEDNLNSTPEKPPFSESNDVKLDCTTELDGIQGNAENACKELRVRGRKRRKASDNSTPETIVLRRSSRRGSSKNNTMTTSAGVNDSLVSSEGSAFAGEKPVKSRREEPVVPPPKVQLPPSSQNLDLVGLPVLDIFSIYACLRSFSTLLFLSPFELEEFVESLKCDAPSSLFDWVHVSILQALRKHLEYLSDEGSESASDCLRSLNWDFLDVITWPLYMVEYLLLHGSGLKLDLTHLKLFKCDYYKQPVSVKLEILKCLCDDMIEVEAIRSELTRRSSGAEPEYDFDRNVNPATLKKRRAAVDLSGGSCLTEDAADDTTDWNSDECCLCKMEGSLICCDGCPAAYHSKCVGVASDSLPEGDWYCPECAIDRHKPWRKPRNSLRGAESLGVDPYGRLYFISCGYLLVCESCDAENSFNYYHKDDLNAVIDVLKSAKKYYSNILEAIHKNWDMATGLYGPRTYLDSLNYHSCSDMGMGRAALPSSEAHPIKGETVDERKLEDKFDAGCSDHLDVEGSKSVSPTCMSSEGSAETTQRSSENHNFLKEGPEGSNRSAFSIVSNIPGKSPPLGDNSLTSTSLGTRQENHVDAAAVGPSSSDMSKTNKGTSQIQSKNGYVNYYSFGRISSLVAEELMSKSSNKNCENSMKSEEEIISAQMRIILRNSVKFQWQNIISLNADVRKETCGWCFSCRYPTDESHCLFSMSLPPFRAGFMTEVAALQLEKNSKDHLIDVICHILLIEDRLQGLLSGPWLNPHHTSIWHETALKASDIESVKHLLLMLEKNLHSLALLADWQKHVDSAVIVGSAAHVVTNSSRASSKNGIAKKRARCSEPDSNPSLNSSSGLGMFWWRGGRLSRQLFSWKVLPRSLVIKAARQAGRVKIPGMLYPENSDFARRSKSIAWRAAVDSSTTVEQLALQVRELDSNIRWDEIENTQPLALLDKESRKSIRLFKKVIVRRKSVQQDGTKYLLDFGRRKSVPEVVLRNGSLVEESSSERKKYWVNESYVPLNLLKGFEEKRVARKATTKMSSVKLPGATVVKKPLKKRVFSYLFARAERAEYHQCGHCNKDVPIGEAVCCQYCKGFFHKRHVKKSAAFVSAECTYTCHRCKDGKYMKIDKKSGKGDMKKGKKNTKNSKFKHKKSKKGSHLVAVEKGKKGVGSSWQLRSQTKKKVAIVLPLRRSARRAKLNALQSKKVGGRKRGRKPKSGKRKYKKSKKETSSRKKRTRIHHSYWLNGLLLSGKPDDERVMDFRSKNFLAPSETIIMHQAKCHLCCEAAYTSTLSYISCEICGEWFHGDAYGLDAENIRMIIGFRCHVCCNRTPPVCPHISPMTIHGPEMGEAQIDFGVEVAEDVANDVPHPMEIEGPLPVVESVVQEGTSQATDLSFVPEDELEAKNGDLFGNVKENANAILTFDNIGKSDSLRASDVGLEEKMTEPGDDANVALHHEGQPSPCKTDADVKETELALALNDNTKNPDGTRDSLMVPVLKSPIDGAVLDSIELHPQSCIVSSEQ